VFIGDNLLPRPCRVTTARSKRRMERWYAAPYWSLALLGYPVALLFAWRYRSMLRRAVRAQGFVAR
jgi:hypothetical protein